MQDDGDNRTTFAELKQYVRSNAVFDQSSNSNMYAGRTQGQAQGEGQCASSHAKHGRPVHFSGHRREEAELVGRSAYNKVSSSQRQALRRAVQIKGGGSVDRSSIERVFEAVSGSSIRDNTKKQHALLSIAEMKRGFKRLGVEEAAAAGSLFGKQGGHSETAGAASEAQYSALMEAVYREVAQHRHEGAVRAADLARWMFTSNGSYTEAGRWSTDSRGPDDITGPESSKSSKKNHSKKNPTAPEDFPNHNITFDSSRVVSSLHGQTAASASSAVAAVMGVPSRGAVYRSQRRALAKQEAVEGGEEDDRYRDINDGTVANALKPDHLGHDQATLKERELSLKQARDAAAGDTDMDRQINAQRWQTVSQQSYKPVGKASGAITEHRRCHTWMTHYSDTLSRNKASSIPDRGW
jgi:hypothetical protein